MSSHKVHYDACPLGHANLASTARYTRVSNKLIRSTQSPLDRLTLEVVPPT
jgi:integrase/recombinase XerD